MSFHTELQSPSVIGISLPIIANVVFQYARLLILSRWSKLILIHSNVDPERARSSLRKEGSIRKTRRRSSSLNFRYNTAVGKGYFISRELNRWKMQLSAPSNRWKEFLFFSLHVAESSITKSCKRINCVTMNTCITSGMSKNRFILDVDSVNPDQNWAAGNIELKQTFVIRILLLAQRKAFSIDELWRTVPVFFNKHPLNYPYQHSFI